MPKIDIRSVLPSLRGGRWRIVFLSVAVLAVFFALGFRLFFPLEALRQRLEAETARQTGARVEVKRLSLGLPLALKMHGLQIDSRRPKLPPLQVESLELSPGWLSLVSGDPGVDVAGELYAGEMLLNLARSGRFHLELDGLRLERLPAVALSQTPVRLGGTLSGRVDAAKPPLAQDADTAIDLRLDGAVVSGLEPLGIADGQIRIGDVTGRGALKGRRLEIETLRASGGDMRIDGEGSILIGADPRRSRLNLKIEMRPGEGFEPMLRDLISLSGSKPSPDGSYRFRIGGSLARPVLR